MIFSRVQLQTTNVLNEKSERVLSFLKKFAILYKMYFFEFKPIKMKVFYVMPLIVWFIYVNCKEIPSISKVLTKDNMKFSNGLEASKLLHYSSGYKIGNKHFKDNIKENIFLSDQMLHFVIREKLLEIKNVLVNGSFSKPSFEILNLDSMFVIVSDEQMHLNISIDNLEIRGLSGMDLKDIASNMKTRRVSALLVFPNVRISAFYKVSGISNIKNDKIDDTGKLNIIMSEWRTSWSAKVLNLINDTIEVTQMAIKSHYDSSNASYDSFLETKKNNDIDLNELITSMLMDKVVRIVDEKFIELFKDIVKERLISQPDSQWTNAKSILDRHLSRRKRQVPCEVGEELDEYVDSLFRFGKRLVRVMEPFSLPNVTVELEEYNVQIFLHSGGASRIYTFERRKPAWVLCQNETISLGLTIGLEEARIMYKFRVIQDWKLLFDGEMEAQVKRPKIQVQISQNTPPESEDEDAEEAPVQQRIDRLKVWRPGQILVIIRGLGNLSSAMSMLVNSMLSNTEMLDPIIKMIETDGVVAANDLLKNISIPIFSII